MYRDPCILEHSGIFFLYTPAFSTKSHKVYPVSQSILDELSYSLDSEILEIQKTDDGFLVEVVKEDKCFLPFNSQKEALEFAREQPTLMCLAK